MQSEAVPRRTNVVTLLEILDIKGEKDADELGLLTGIRKPIIVSTLFLAKKRGQIDSRPKSMLTLEGRYEFSKDDEENCKKLSRWGWDVPEIADRLGMTETYVDTMLLVASAPREVREMVEKGMVDVISTVQSLKDFGDRAVDNIRAMLGGAPQVDGRKPATKGQIYKFLTYQGSKIADVIAEPEEPKVDFAAQLSDFFTSNVRSAIQVYDSKCQKRVVNLENFRGGAGNMDGGRHWREGMESALESRRQNAA